MCAAKPGLPERPLRNELMLAERPSGVRPAGAERPPKAMRKPGREEAQAGIKNARRNINNLRYEDDIALMTESREELKSLSMEVKEESEKAGLKLSVQKMKIMASSPITS